jgi:hypothetical protein
MSSWRYRHDHNTRPPGAPFSRAPGVFVFGEQFLDSDCISWAKADDANVASDGRRAFASLAEGS